MCKKKVTAKRTKLIRNTKRKMKYFQNYTKEEEEEENGDVNNTATKLKL